MNDRLIELLIKELTGEISGEELVELKYIIKENKAYAKEAELYRLYWKKNNFSKVNNDAVFEKVKSKINAKGGAFTEEETVPADIKEEPEASNLHFGLWLKVAAALVLLCSSYLIFENYTNSEGGHKKGANWLVKETARGVKSVFILNDGTRIALNSGSKLEFPKHFESDIREVYLTGEAFFDVHEDKLRPFIIHTKQINIKVLGTAFNVKSYPGERTSETTLIRGSIAVTMNDKPDERIVLKPDQKLVVDNERESGSFTHPADERKILKPELTTITYFRNDDTTIVETSWVNNKLIFKNEDFGSVAKKMERWYNIDFRFKQDQARQLKFTGVFEKETVEEALNALKLTENFEYKIENSEVYIF